MFIYKAIVKGKIIFNYAIEYHLDRTTVEVRNLFELLNPQIKTLPEVGIYATGNYIGYKNEQRKSPFIEMHFRKRSNKIALHLRPIDYSFSKLKVTQKPDSHRWKLNTVIDLYIEAEIEPALDLIRLSYQHVLDY